ncbi:hypothetical protein N9937_01525 [bacterium]|nr:hypothetical protein [bacterium]
MGRGRVADDLTGIQHAFLVPIRMIGASTTRNGTLWECRCRCGNIVEVRSRRLRMGSPKSCGCVVVVKGAGATADPFDSFKLMIDGELV